MATYTQLPGVMGLRFRAGDSVSTLIDFDPVSLSGHTVTATVTSLVTGQSIRQMAASVTDAAGGKVNISLTEQETLAMPVGSYGWELAWVSPGGTKRTALSGILEVTR